MPSFNRAATTYHQHAAPQRAAANALLGQLLALKPEPTSIVELGGGTGILTEKLCQHFPQVPITVIDNSPHMIAQAKRRLKDPQINWECQSIESIATPHQTDLLVSSMALHWLKNPSHWVTLAHKSLVKDGYLAIALAGPGTFATLRECFKTAYPHYPELLSSRFLNQTELEQQLFAKFKIESSTTTRILHRVHNVYAALRHIKSTGVYAKKTRQTGLLTPSHLKNIDRLYPVHPEGGIDLEYEVIVIIAKPH